MDLALEMVIVAQMDLKSHNLCASAIKDLKDLNANLVKRPKEHKIKWLNNYA